MLAVNLRDGGDPSKPAPVSPSSVTLEVSDAMAQEIRLAEKNGTISLSLRSIRDDGVNSPEPTGVSDLSKASGSRPMGVVRGPGSAGGKMNFEDVSAGAQVNPQGTPAVIRGGIMEPAVQPATSVSPQSVNNKASVGGNK